MKHFNLLCIVCFELLFSISTTARAQQDNQETLPLEVLFEQLDNAVEHADENLAKKRQQIKSIQTQYSRSTTPTERYQLASRLFEEYKRLANDSAIKYGKICVDLAQELGQKDSLINSQMRLAHQYSTGGNYEEAMIYMNHILPTSLTPQVRANYYANMGHLYGELATYSKDPDLSNRYWKQTDAYRDSLMNMADSTSVQWFSQKVSYLLGKNQIDEALHYCDIWSSKAKPESSRYALLAFMKSELYKKKGNKEQQKRWLILSALSDLNNCIMNQASLWTLAGLLSEEGDLDRAYRYVEYSWHCASIFNAHLRSWQISPVLTVINDHYKSKLRQTNHTLWILILIVSILAIVLLGLYVYVRNKRRQLATAHTLLRKANNEQESLNKKLSEKNQELSESNQLLSETNKQLKLAMSHLNDSNRVKEEYIGKFLSLCSQYIDKMENYRIKVNRKLKAGQQTDLLRMTSSDQLREDELKELFDNFDKVFLHLFPTFIDDFNALLIPTERIKISREEQRLNTDLRIFALIRLGIDESSKIAEFLRYSPNSIYAYRARIKNKAAGNRDDFERLVKEIGIIEE